VNVKLRRKAKARKRKMLRRIDKNNWSGSSPMINPPSIKYEMADKQQVWKQQPDEFFECAIIESDGTFVETSAEKKEGIGINYKGQWGYHPLVVTLANTREPLFIANRSGNRPSHENSAFYFDLAVRRCRGAGFRKVVLRGDTDFALTENFDRWDDDNVEFVFGIDAMPNLVKIAENLDPSGWKPMKRRRLRNPTPARRRAKRQRVKERIVEQNEYLNKKLVSERIAEFDYQPSKCDRTYRVVVLHKEVHVKRGQLRLFDKEEPVYFFYITNAKKSSKPMRQVVIDANARCNQENNIAQLKQCALSAPLSDLTSNWAHKDSLLGAKLQPVPVGDVARDDWVVEMRFTGVWLDEETNQRKRVTRMILRGGEKVECGGRVYFTARPSDVDSRNSFVRIPYDVDNGDRQREEHLRRLRAMQYAQQLRRSQLQRQMLQRMQPGMNTSGHGYQHGRTFALPPIKLGPSHDAGSNSSHVPGGGGIF
jgi:hypothetical protein